MEEIVKYVLSQTYVVKLLYKFITLKIYVGNYTCGNIIIVWEDNLKRYIYSILA